MFGQTKNLFRREFMNDSASKEQYVTIKNVAKSAGVTIETVRRWDREGKLKPQGRNSRGWRYYLFTDVEQLLKGHSQCESGSRVEFMDESVHELSIACEIYRALQRGDNLTASDRCKMLQNLLNADAPA